MVCFALVMVGFGVFNTVNNTKKVLKLHSKNIETCYMQNYNYTMFFLSNQHTKETFHEIPIFTNLVNDIYLINNHIRHPISQHNCLDKLLIASIVHPITWFRHKSLSTKVRAHSIIKGNEIFIYI